MKRLAGLLCAGFMVLCCAEAYAAYPDREAWANSPPSPWTLKCSETLDSTDTISGGFWNPSESTTAGCNGGGWITDAGADMWDTVAASGNVTLPAGATITRLLRVDNQLSSSAGTITSFSENSTFPVSTGRFAQRFYVWFSSAVTGIPSGSPGNSSYKFFESRLNTSQMGSNQAQAADPKDSTGNFHMFFSAPASSASCIAIGSGGRGVTRIGGQQLTLHDCKSTPCRAEQAITWDGTNLSIEYKVTKVNADGSDGIYDERRDTCQPGVSLTGFGPGGMFINNFVENAGVGTGYYRYLSLYLAAYTTDVTLGRWLGPASEMQPGASGPVNTRHQGTTVSGGRL